MVGCKDAASLLLLQISTDFPKGREGGRNCIERPVVFTLYFEALCS